MKNLLLAGLVMLVAGSSLRAEIKTKTVEYEAGGAKLKGFLAWDDASAEKRPGVLVVHEWWGLNDYARDRARQLAKLGYVAFAVDMYGEGKVTEHPKEAGEWAGEVRKNKENWLERAKAGLKILKDNELVDSSRLAGIGYCFGGSTVLQLAHHGEDLKAVASFHGALSVPEEDQAKTIKSKILICHGALDSFIPEALIQKVRAAYEKGKVDYQFIYYAGAYHSFTVPNTPGREIPGIRYNAEADRRSWQHMRALFEEAFAPQK